MADKNVQIKFKNSQGTYDNIYPKTKIELVEGLGTAASRNVGTSNGNVPVIGNDGKLDSSILPAIAITDTFVVNSESAMLALNAQVGDVAVRTDLSKTFILKTEPASNLSNWQELLTPVSPVQSVNGKTGAVILSKNDIGLGSVENYGIATQAEAEAGIVDNKYMTPLKVKQAIAKQTENLGGGDMLKSTYDTNNDGKVDAAETADSVPWNGITGKPSTFPPSSHSHSASDLPNASTSSAGIVMLNNSTSSTSTTQAATANAVKVTFDLASSKSRIVVSETQPTDADIWFQEI